MSTCLQLVATFSETDDDVSVIDSELSYSS